MALPPADAFSNSLPTSAAYLATSPDRDPIPPSNPMQGYIDVFVDDFIYSVQGNEHKHRVPRIPMHAIDQLFQPLDLADNKFCQEPVSIKNSAKETAPGLQSN